MEIQGIVYYVAAYIGFVVALGVFWFAVCHVGGASDDV